jgi:hypothetical protein
MAAIGQDGPERNRSMPELTSLNEIEERIRALELNREGVPTVSTAYVLDRLLVPLLEIAKRGPGALTLTGALRELSQMKARAVSEKYLTRSLASLGGRSRLEVWREQGLAEQTEEGIWLISRAALAEPAVWDEEEDAQGVDPEVAAEELYRESV